MFCRFHLKYIVIILLIFSNLKLSSVPLADKEINNKSPFFEFKNNFEKCIDNDSKSEESSNSWYQRWLWNNQYNFDLFGNEAKQDYSINQNNSKYHIDHNLSDINWVPVGPLVLPPTYEPRSCYGLGRINCVAFHPTDSNTLYIGTPGGGVWKTINGGKTWKPLTDNLSTLAVSSIAVDPKNPDIVYFASGDVDTGYLSDGNAQGVFKSIDGGITWKQTDLVKDSKFQNSLLRKIIINPVNTSFLLAAGKRGIWRSDDAGDTWKFILDSVITDIELNPSNPNIVFAAMVYLNSNQGMTGVMKSTNFGATWQLLKTGMPERDEIGRLELAVTPADPKYIYALGVFVGNKDYSKWGGLHSVYLSTDEGDTWKVQSTYKTAPNFLGAYNGDSNDTRGQGTYDLVLIADPIDKNKIYAGGTNSWMSTDAGATWDITGFWIYCFGPSIHADHHYAAYNPLNKYFYWANDGGIYRTKEIKQGSKDWITDWVDRWEENIKPNAPDFKFPTKWENITDGLAISEFYRIALCRDVPYVVTGGTQDNSCFLDNQGNWVNYIANYDGMETMVDNKDPDLIYGVWQYGGLCRSSDGGKNITKRLADTIIYKLNESGNWVTPVGMDPLNSNNIYIGFRNLYGSANKGDTWQKTFNLDSFANDSSNKASISIIKNSYNSSKHLSIYKNAQWVEYPSSKSWHLEPGQFWITSDGGTTWSLTKNNLPVDSVDITSIDYDYYNPSKMWVSFNWNSYGFSTFMTTDGGKNWSNISKKNGNGIVIRTMVHQPNSLRNALYAGTNKGIYYTDDSLTEWIPFNKNLPNCIVNKLVIQYQTNEIYAGTYGRGIWKTSLLPDNVKEQKNIQSEVSISPNPSNGKFNIKFEENTLVNSDELQIIITDVTGRKVYETKKSTATEINIECDLSAGDYYIHLISNQKKFFGKLIIIK